jgi:glycosyltransferase involved in cell wall biosynthesis
MNQVAGLGHLEPLLYRSTGGARPAAAGPKILSLTCVYPTPVEPGRGLFVRSRLERLGAMTDLKVVAPVWRWPLGSGNRIPYRTQGPVEVLYPGWMYIPGSGALAPLFLFLQLLPRLRRLRKEFAFQVIDSHFGFPEGIAAGLLARALGIPFTVTLRGSELLHSRYRLRRRMMGWALGRAGRVIAVSEQLRRFAMDLGVDEARTRVIPNGVEAGVFYPRDRMEARKRQRLPLDRRIILTAGHLIELKGHHHAIAAVKRLVDEGRPVQLLIAGGPPGRGIASYEAELRRLIPELDAADCVRMLGHVDVQRLAELMSAADVFCLASSREGWPNVVHEALACGTPVVATRVGGVPELISRPAYGLLVPPNDPHALQAALGDALARTWNHAEISAWAQARSWERVSGEVLDEMAQVVNTFDQGGLAWHRNR